MENNEFIPCPFCGKTDVKIQSIGGFPLYGFIHFCNINGASITISSNLFSTREEAVNMWNRRERVLRRNNDN